MTIAFRTLLLTAAMILSGVDAVSAPTQLLAARVVARSARPGPLKGRCPAALY